MNFIKTVSISKYFTLLIVIFPILTIYKSPIPEIRLSTFILILLSPFVLNGVSKKNNIGSKVGKKFIVFFFYILFSTLLSILFLVEDFDINLIALRVTKFILLPTLVLLIINKKYFNLRYGLQLLQKITLIASVFLIFQTIIFYSTGILISGVIKSFLEYDAYANHDYLEIALSFYRPTSFFAEPSHFCHFVLVGLIYSLWGFNDKPKKIINALIISLAILLSTSGQGLILLIFCWTFYVLKQTKESRFGIIYIIFGLSIILMTSVYISNFEIVAKSLDRVLNLDAKGGNAFLARTNSYSYFFEFPTSLKLIGMGFGNPIPGVYFNSISYTLYCNGIIGFFLILSIFYSCYKQAIGFQKVVCIFLLGLLFGATLFTATSIIFYFSFLLNNNNLRNKIINVNN